MRYHIQKNTLNINLFMLFLVLTAQNALASTLTSHQNAFCQDIESTSDAAKCLKDHLKDAETRLQSTFNSLSQKLDEESAKRLLNAQKYWNNFKVEHCDWKVSNSETPTEKHLELLSCKANLSEQRIDALSKEIHASQNNTQEYGELSRWMNVVAYDYPNVFWQYNKRLQTDLNCDGNQEWVMLGTALQRQEQKKVEEITKQDKDKKGLNSSFLMDIVITIAENPKIGRPQSQLFRIPLNPQSQGIHLCNPIIKLVEVTPELDKSCASNITLTDDICGPVKLYWNGQDYKLSQPNNEERQ